MANNSPHPQARPGQGWAATAKAVGVHRGTLWRWRKGAADRAALTSSAAAAVNVLSWLAENFANSPEVRLRAADGLLTLSAHRSDATIALATKARAEAYQARGEEAADARREKARREEETLDALFYRDVGRTCRLAGLAQPGQSQRVETLSAFNKKTIRLLRKTANDLEREERRARPASPKVGEAGGPQRGVGMRISPALEARLDWLAGRLGVRRGAAAKTALLAGLRAYEAKYEADEAELLLTLVRSERARRDLIAERSPLAEATIGSRDRSDPLDTPEIPTPLPPSYKSVC